jgi:lipopolysaccharide transport system ATP-binding protein
MSAINVKNLVVEFPVFEARSRSLKYAVMRTATGGRLANDSGQHVVVRALDNVSFNLREGDRVGLLGHNGSGKSTLLRVLAGAYKPTSGEVSVVGKVGSMISLTLGMDFEASGLENIQLRGALMGFRLKEMKSITEDVIEFADLGDYIHMPMRTYSSGMAMRLAFALATAGTSDVILMDEWVSAGDAGFAERADVRLREKLDRAKVMVLASHSEDLIRRQCNVIMRLEHGKVVDFSRSGV